MTGAVAAAHVDELCVLDEFILEGLFDNGDFGLDFDDHGILREARGCGGNWAEVTRNVTCCQR